MDPKDEDFQGIDDDRYPEPDYSKPLPARLVAELWRRGIQIPDRFLTPEDQAEQAELFCSTDN